MVAISSGVTLLQQESLYDYLLNPLVVSMAHCFPVKKRGGFGISSARSIPGDFWR
jgi:hypothetical protein